VQSNKSDLIKVTFLIKFDEKNQRPSMSTSSVGIPTMTDTNGTKEWTLNGQPHRENGAAIEMADGTKIWFILGKIHREDGHAIEFANGNKEWRLNGQLHRDDGPAIEWWTGNVEFYLNGLKCTEEELSCHMTLVKRAI
jgi:hypothetical protein